MRRRARLRAGGGLVPTPHAQPRGRQPSDQLALPDGERAGGELRLTCPSCGPLEGAWRCHACGGAQLRAPQVGVTRTAEELGLAFPQVKVVQSWGGHRIDSVGPEPGLVLATPGAEPLPQAGYAAAVLLDAGVMLARPDLRAGEEALRRWLDAAALVRPGERGGTVLIVGESGERPVQALVRLDSVAEREMALQKSAEGYRAYFKATEQNRKAGGASVLDLETARRSAITTEIRLIELQQNRLEYWIALYKAVGGGWQGQQGETK